MTRGLRALLASLTLAATAFAATGCGGDAADAASSSTQVTLTVGDQAKSLQTLLSASGVLKGTSYKVKWAEFEGAAPLFQAVQAGAADTSYAADLPTLQAQSGGVPVKGVAALHNDGSSVGIVVQKNSSVKKVSDLKGKKVVVSSARGSIAEYLLANALQQAGLKYSDVQVQYLLPTDAQAAFTAGKIDAWATFGVYKAAVADQGARQIVDGTGGRVSGYGFIGASDKALADTGKKAAIKDLLQRVDKALTWSGTHQDAYAKAIEKNTGAKAAVAQLIVKQSYGELVPITPAVTKAVQGVADTMHGIKVLDPDVVVADSVDTSLFAK
ncbi:ABC transporter substrate-binding protein [Streptomyces sp. NPDC059373]